MLHRGRQSSHVVHGLAATAVAGCLAGIVPGCELEDIPAKVCGNRVVEGTEECDHFVAHPGLECGAPGTALACRHVCAGAEEYGCTDCCPEGSSCGLDGLCRRPTGTFAVAGEVYGGAEELVGGDLDGDLRADFVRVLEDEIVVVFGSDRDQAPVAQRQSYEPLFLPTLVQRPSPQPDQQCRDDGSTDGRPADLVLPRSGMVVLQATRERELTPTSLPALPLPPKVEEFAILPLDMKTTDQVLDLLFHVRLGDLQGLTYVGEHTFVPFALTRGSPDERLGAPLIEHFDTRDPTKCKELVLAYQDQPALELFNPCRLGASGWEPNVCLAFICPEDLPRRLQVGKGVARGPFAADFNDDGPLDLLVQVRDPASTSCGYDECYETRVAYGVGDGTFHSNPDEVATIGEGDNTFAVTPARFVSDGAPLLAVGDFDGVTDDGRRYIDAVTPRDVRLYFGDYLSEEVAVANFGEPWTEVAVADFNGNDIPDLAAVKADNPRVYFYNGVGDGIFNSFTIPTTEPPYQLQVGDFDGDLIRDLAAVSDVACAGNAEVKTRREVLILFGSAAGSPEPPLAVGHTEQSLRLTTGLLAADLLLLVEDLVDGNDDIIAVGTDEDSASIHAFVGRGDREIRSPLGLFAVSADNVAEAEFRPHLSRKLVAGRFQAPRDGQEEPSPQQLAVLSMQPSAPAADYVLWLVPKVSEDLDAGTIQQTGPAIQPYDPGTEAVWERGLYGAVDMDGDGDDEMVAMAPLPTDPHRSAYRIARLEEGQWEWFPADGVGLLDVPLARYEGPTVPCRDPYGFPTITDCAETDFSEVVSTKLRLPRTNGRLRICDLDGDYVENPPGTAPSGREELVILSRPASAEEPDEPAKVLVYRVLPGDGLALETNRFANLDLGLPPNEQPRDVACLQADGARHDAIAVLTDASVWIAQCDLPQSPAPGATVPCSSHAVAGTAGFRRVLTGDLNGDGLEDLVLANETETRRYLSGVVGGETEGGS